MVGSRIAAVTPLEMEVRLNAPTGGVEIDRVDASEVKPDSLRECNDFARERLPRIELNERYFDEHLVDCPDGTGRASENVKFRALCVQLQQGGTLYRKVEIIKPPRLDLE